MHLASIMRKTVGLSSTNHHVKEKRNFHDANLIDSWQGSITFAFVAKFIILYDCSHSVSFIVNSTFF